MFSLVEQKSKPPERGTLFEQSLRDINNDVRVGIGVTLLGGVTLMSIELIDVFRNSQYFFVERVVSYVILLSGVAYL